MFADQRAMRTFCLLSVVLLTAACSGGTGSGLSDDDGREDLVPIMGEVAEGPAGSASYAGPMNLAFTAPVSTEAISLTGNLSLQVDFDSFDTAVTGSAGGFTHDATAYVGTLFLTTGTIDGADEALDFAAYLSGSLQDGTNAYLIFGQLSGEFTGPNQEVSSGSVLGTARQSGFDTPVSGQFQTVRQ